MFKAGRLAEVDLPQLPAHNLHAARARFADMPAPPQTP
jgi:hypothetical protein